MTSSNIVRGDSPLFEQEEVFGSCMPNAECLIVGSRGVFLIYAFSFGLGWIVPALLDYSTATPTTSMHM